MAWYPKAEQYPVDAFWSGHEGALRAICHHIMEGPGEKTVKNYLRTSGKSWHFSICENGKVYQHVDTVNSAWANGLWWDRTMGWFRTVPPRNHDLRPYRNQMWQRLNTTSSNTARRNPNWYTWSVEHGGFSGKQQKRAVFDADVELYTWLARLAGWDRLIVGENLIGHSMIDPINKAKCPGSGFNLSRIAAAVTERLQETVSDTDTLERYLNVTMLGYARFNIDHTISSIESRENGEYMLPEIITIVRAYDGLCKEVDVDPRIAIAQCMHETASLSSAWAARPYRNPAGIGVTGVPGVGLAFESWADHAIPAHVGRLLAYALPAGHGTDAQQALIERALTVRPLTARYRGSVKAIKDLGAGTWATDPNYATKLARTCMALF